MRILEDSGLIRGAALVDSERAIAPTGELEEQRRQSDLEQAIYWAKKRYRLNSSAT